MSECLGCGAPYQAEPGSIWQCECEASQVSEDVELQRTRTHLHTVRRFFHLLVLLAARAWRSAHVSDVRHSVPPD
jgi:hypothetical protein